MVFADTARSQLFYLEETVWGQTPAAALNAVRFTGESLNFSIDNTQSNEIRSDRQITDLIQTDAEPGGDINFELSYGAFDDLIAGALFNDWATAVNISAETTIAAASGSPDSFTDSANGFVTAGIQPGQWIKVSGFATQANNGYFQVLTVAAGTITVKGETALVNESAGPSVTIVGETLRNGIDAKSFSLETAFNDVTQFKSFTGMRVNNLNLNLSVGEILTGVLSFLGKDAAINNATIGTGGPVAAATNEVLNAVNNVAFIQEGGGAFAGELQEFTVALANNLRSQKAVGTLGNVGIGSGRAVVTGTFNAYFEDETLYNKYLNGTESSLALRVTDAAGNAYILTFPRIKFTAANLAAGSADSDVVVEMEYQAVRHPTYDFTFQIDRFPAA